MNRRLSHVVDINPELRRPWTVLIQVLENGHVQQSRSGSEFKRLVFTDTQGTKFTALIYSNHIRYFAALLSPYKSYYISNAIVVYNDTRYRISSYPCSWILNNRTLIEELVQPIPAIIPCGFDFTQFHDLHRHADTENLQNVRGVVLRSFPTKEHGPEMITTRDIVIVNEEKKLLLLTLWNEFAENEGTTLANIIETGPLLFAMRVKVSTFNCLSLTTRASSGLMINLPVIEDLQMHEWYNNNKQELQQLLDVENYKNHELLLPYPADNNIIPISTAITSLKTIKTAWIEGKISHQSQDRSYWYTACSNCQKSLEADITWVVICPSCKEESEVHAISRLTVVIDDGTGSIIATMCSPDVEEFIPFDATQLKKADENGIDVRDNIATSIQQHTIVAFIRSYDVIFRGQTETKVNIVKAYKSHNPIDALPPPNQPASADPTTTSIVHPTEDKMNEQSITSTSAKRQPTKKEGAAKFTHESTNKKTKHSAP